MDRCVCVCALPLCKYLLRPEEGIRSPGAEVASVSLAMWLRMMRVLGTQCGSPSGGASALGR